MALAAIVTGAWRFMGIMRSRVDDWNKPHVDALAHTKAQVSVLEAKVKMGDDALTSFKLEVARVYTTKEDVINANKPVLDSVDRLTSSVDKMNTRIDRVIEQSNTAKPASRRRAAD